MVLLDTNVVLWALTGHRRARPLLESGARLFLSPVSLLELQFLVEVGKLEPTQEGALDQVRRDSRWVLDDPTSDRLFRAALPLGFTRDPFDRLLAAHARHRRWKLATGDRRLREQLPATSTVEV